MLPTAGEKMNRSKIRGRKFEYRIRDILEENGWTVFRSAGSHTSADLIGLKSGSSIVLVQVKAAEVLYLSPAEKSDLLSYKVSFGAIPLVAHRKTGKWRIHFYTIDLDGKLLSISTDQLRQWGVLK